MQTISECFLPMMYCEGADSKCCMVWYMLRMQYVDVSSKDVCIS